MEDFQVAVRDVVVAHDRIAAGVQLERCVLANVPTRIKGHNTAAALAVRSATVQHLEVPVASVVVAHNRETAAVDYN